MSIFLFLYFPIMTNTYNLQTRASKVRNLATVWSATKCGITTTIETAVRDLLTQDVVVTTTGKVYLSPYQKKLIEY